MKLRDYWARARQARWSGRWHRGRFTAWGEVTAHELPLPSVWAGFTECEVSLGVQLGGPRDRLGDPLAGVSIAVELPGWAADTLVLVWPGIARRDRRDALSRLLRAASDTFDATPQGTPTIREDPQ